MSVQQAILQAQANAERGLRHTAVLYLAKAYDKVDGKKILCTAEKWLTGNEVDMMRAMLRVMKVRTRGEPTNYLARLTRGVPQGALSSPTYFNMYVNELAEEMERQGRGRGDGDGEIVLVADDVLCQARNQEILQELLNVAECWAIRKNVVWSDPKCVYIAETEVGGGPEYLAGEEMKRENKVNIWG